MKKKNKKILIISVIAIVIILAFVFIFNSNTPQTTYTYKETANSTSAMILESPSNLKYINLNNMIDNDWNTNASLGPLNGGTWNQVLIKYSVPANAVSAIWKIKDTKGTRNIIIPASCLKSGNLTLLISTIVTASELYMVSLSCTDSPDRLENYDDTKVAIYENQIIWTVSSSITCTPPQIIDTSTNTCITPVNCTYPMLLDTATNTCVQQVTCSPPLILNEETSSCEIPTYSFFDKYKYYILGLILIVVLFFAARNRKIIKIYKNNIKTIFD